MAAKGTATPPTTAPRALLRQVMSRFATGVVVIGVGGEHIHGMTANAFTSVSLDPPLVVCCVAHTAVMHRAISSTGRFAVSVLDAAQQDLARHFADKDRPLGPAQFADVRWTPGERTGAPVLDDALAWLECDLERAVDCGDHTLFIGTVLAAGRGEGRDGLLFFDGGYHTLSTPAPTVPAARTAAPHHGSPQAAAAPPATAPLAAEPTATPPSAAAPSAPARTSAPARPGAPRPEALSLPRVDDDPRLPAARLARLLDPGPVEVLHPTGDSGVAVVRGAVDGTPVVAFATDATRMGGALGATGADQVIRATEAAVADGVPVIGLWHSGGAKLADGVESMDGVGRMFAAMTAASGRVPQLSVVLGPAAGAASYGPALTDLVVLADAGRMFVTGPDVVRSVTGERIDMTGLGGPEAHGAKSGVAHVVAADEDDALARARRLAVLLASPARIVPDDGGTDPGTLLPASPRRAYDVRPVVRAVLDADSFEELQAKWAPNVVVGLGRLGGGTIGVVANNPLRKGGCLDSLSAEKASRFVRMCDSFGIPLVVLVDVPGYLPGVGQEWGGVIRRGAKLLHAFAESVVPRVTVITRKAYGGAYIAMNSRSIGATSVFAWPDAEVAVMGAEAAVTVLHRKQLAATAEADRPALLARLVAEHQRVSGGVRRALDLAVVDEVIHPRETRRRIAEALLAARPARGAHGNIPL
ncbi:carboxyl transferase domain-containing protein [Saccharothrix sp. Mg75]|uniref:carboxyl transferase domain-containing protein n=1 Tax=Saccharothrix sp. Mg75 TaxID=3445357 RepID=UPI003EEE7655